MKLARHAIHWAARSSAASRRAPLVASVFLLIAAGLASWRFASKWPGLDYYPCWLIADWIRDGGDGAIYGETAQRALAHHAWRKSVEGLPRSKEMSAAAFNVFAYKGRLEQYGTPFQYALVAAMTTGSSYDADLNRFKASCFAAYVASLLAAALAFGLRPASALAAAALLTIPASAYAGQLITTNVGALQAAGITGGIALLAWRGRPVDFAAGGFLLAIGIGIKPTALPALVAAVMAVVLARRMRHALALSAGAAMGAAYAWCIGCLFLSSWTVWQAWAADLATMLASDRPFDRSNPFIVAWLRARLGVDLSVPLLLALLALLAFAAWRGAGARQDHDDRRLARRVALAASLGAGAALLASPYGWTHYYLLASPLILWAVSPGAIPPRGRRGWMVAIACSLVGMSSLPRLLGIMHASVDRILLNGGVAILVVLGVIRLAGLAGSEAAEPSGHQVADLPAAGAAP